MRVATVIPLVRLPSSLGVFDYMIPEALADTLAMGHLVRVPFRNRLVAGIVWSVDATPESDRVLKVIDRLLFDIPLIRPHNKVFIEWFSRTHGVSLAAALKLSISPPALRRHALSSSGRLIAQKLRTSSEDILHAQEIDKAVLATATSEYSCAIETLNSSVQILIEIAAIKRALDGGRGALIIAPTVHRAHAIAQTLLAYFGEAVYLIAPTQSKNERWNLMRALASTEPRIYVGTKSALLLPFSSLGVVVIDDAGSPDHKQWDQHPRYDARILAKKITTLANATLLYCDTFLRCEEWISVSKESREHRPSYAPALTWASLDDAFKSGNATWITDELEGAIQETIRSRAHVFLFLNKKGTSRMAVCKDCDYLFACPTCHAPYRYSENTQILSCDMCHTSERLPDECPSCKSMRFHFPGLGIEKAARALKKLFPETPIVIVQKDTEKPATPTTPTIYIGTTAAFVSLVDIFPVCGLFSALFADPFPHLYDFRAVETQLHTLCAILRLSVSFKKPCVFQHFSISDHYRHALSTGDTRMLGDIISKERTQFHLPPATTITRLRYKHKDPAALHNEYLRLERHLRDTATRIDKTDQKRILRIAYELDHLKNSSLAVILDIPFDYELSLPDWLEKELTALPVGWLIDRAPLF